MPWGQYLKIFAWHSGQFGPIFRRIEAKELMAIIPHKQDDRSAEREQLKRGSKEARIVRLKFRGFESGVRYSVRPTMESALFCYWREAA